MGELFQSLIVASFLFLSGGIAHAHPMLGSELAETNNGDAKATSTTLLSDLDANTLSADDFVLNTDVELTGVRWWGGFTGINGPTFPAFPTGMIYTLSIYDGDTMPTTLITSSTLTLDSAPAPDLFSSNNTAIWEINARLDTHISGLTPGTKYWVSIASKAGDGHDNAVWASSDIPGNAYANQSGGVGTWSGPQGAELAFVLFGDSVVPEPTSFALLGVGALGFMGYSWRRRRGESAEV